MAAEKRAIEICKNLSITFKTLTSYGNILGIEIKSISEKIPSEVADWIYKVHFDDYAGRLPPRLLKKQDSKKGKLTPALSNRPLPYVFSRENSFSDDTASLFLNESPFEKRKAVRRKIGNDYVNTIFSDFEAFSICHGLKNRHANHMARCFFQNQTKHAFTIEAHQLAMATLKDYGPKLLSYVLSLPPLPFKAFNAGQIFAAIDKRKANQQFPIIRINFENSEGENEKIEITFLMEDVDWKKERNENVLQVKNKTTGQQLMQIARNGKVVPNALAREVVPVLQLFVRFSQDARSMILNYGLETGECSICGRPLNDAESLRRGIGPVCYRSI